MSAPSTSCASTASASTRWPRRCSERETLDENDAYRAAGFERGSAPGDRPPHGLLKEPSNADATPSSDLA